MERKQKGRREAEEEGGRRRKAGTTTEPATTLGVAEEATIASAGDNRACSDGGSGKDECGSSERCRTRGWGASKTGPLCYGYRSGEKLLRLRRIRAYGPQL